MPLASRQDRSDFLQENYPPLYKLCVASPLPAILKYRFSTKMSFCYAHSDDGSPIPAGWDSDGVRVIPLWEAGSSLTAIRTTASTREFIQIDFEDPEDVDILANSADGLFTYLFYFLVESSEHQVGSDLRDVEDLAQYLGFHGLAYAVDLVERLSDEEDYEKLFGITRAI